MCRPLKVTLYKAGQENEIKIANTPCPSFEQAGIDLTTYLFRICPHGALKPFVNALRDQLALSYPLHQVGFMEAFDAACERLLDTDKGDQGDV